MTKCGGLAMRRLANVDYSTAFVMLSTIAFMEAKKEPKPWRNLLW
jgi:hypothetical protein